MGLDMYLTKERYLSSYDETDKRIIEQIEKLTGMVNIKTVTADCIYWRKANAIHGWFVDQCQGGVDECQRVCLSLDQLQELHDEINQVIESKDSQGLTPMKGFFFGSADVDEYYWEYLRETRDKLKAVLSADDADKYSYYYQSSW